jgi:hypothetical protein
MLLEAVQMSFSRDDEVTYPRELAVCSSISLTFPDAYRLDHTDRRAYERFDPLPLKLRLPLFPPILLPFIIWSQRGFMVGTQPQIITREISNLGVRKSAWE